MRGQSRRQYNFIMAVVFALAVIFASLAEAGGGHARAADTANYTNLVLCAYFQDDAVDATFLDEDKSGKLVDAYNGTSDVSVKNYFETISYGAFRVDNVFPQYDGTVIVPVCLPSDMTKSEAAKRNMDESIIDYVAGVATIPEALNLDRDGDGFVDNLTIILIGGEEGENTNSSFVSHKSDYPGEKQINGKYIGTYNMLNTKRIFTQIGTSWSAESGVICHEFLHSLGYPDLYNSDDEPPVSMWDIMAVANKGTWPLAYLRMSISNWVSLDTITESTTLTLDRQSVSTGHPAYILKSPLNEQELFVVEYRQKSYSPDTMDRFCGYSGVLVYRVDTTVEGLSNHFGQTGVYVFRPENGLYYAALSAENGRTSIGSSDMNATLSDGALTFRDGTNSGIVIKNVAVSGEQMTLEVEIPSLEDVDVWTDTQFVDRVPDNSKKFALAEYGGCPLLAAATYGKLSSYRYADGVWETFAADVSVPRYLSDVQVVSSGDDLYLLYGDYSTLTICKYNSATAKWVPWNTVKNCGDFNACETVDGLYVAYTENGTASRLLWLGSERRDFGVYFAGMCGQPRVVSDGDTVYVSVRKADNTVWVYAYLDGRYSLLNTFSGISYDTALYQNKLVVAADAGEGVKLSVYDNAGWTTTNTSAGGFEPKLAANGDKLHLLVTAQGTTGRTKLYLFDEVNNALVKEGADVDSAAYGSAIRFVGSDIYVALLRQTDSKIVVRRRTDTNPPTPGTGGTGNTGETGGGGSTGDNGGTGDTGSTGDNGETGDTGSTGGNGGTGSGGSTGDNGGTASDSGNGSDSGNSDVVHSHTAGSPIVTKNAGCTTAGEVVVRCTDCDTVLHVSELPALGHDYTITTILPDFHTAGYTEYCCKRCGFLYRTDYVPKLVPKEGWNYTNEDWYYVENGTLCIGWKYVGGAWYYMYEDGRMATGWIKDGGTWYYLNKDGDMATGWIKDGGTWYYLTGSGAMATGWIYDGAWYYLTGSGAMATGWIYDGAWYYLTGSGAMATGWVYDGGTWYYMNPDGDMVTGRKYIGRRYYYFGADGAWIR